VVLLSLLLLLLGVLFLSSRAFLLLFLTHLLLYPFPSFPYLFHPSYLPSIFTPRSFSFLSLISLHPFHMIVLDCLSLFIAHSAPSFLSFHPIPVFSLLLPTSKSRHHLSFFCTLSLPRYSVIHLSFFPLYIDSFIFFLLSCLVLSLSLSLSSTFIHLSFALNLFTSSLAYPFLWWYFSLSFFSFSVFSFFPLQHSVSILHSILSILSIPLALFHHYLSHVGLVLFEEAIGLPFDSDQPVNLQLLIFLGVAFISYKLISFLT
jgi:hypothetical protein